MHELSITRSLLDQSLAEAEKHGARRIGRIRLLLGEGGGVVPDCVQFYFDEMKKGTIAAEAELEFKKVPLRIRCPKCGAEWGLFRSDNETAEAAKIRGRHSARSDDGEATRSEESRTDGEVPASPRLRVPSSLFEGMCSCNAGGEVISGQELVIESMEVD